MKCLFCCVEVIRVHCYVKLCVCHVPAGSDSDRAGGPQRIGKKSSQDEGFNRNRAADE